MLTAHLATLLLAITSTGGDVVLLDFRADWCGPCRSMDGAVQQLSAAGYPVRQVNVDQDRALAAKFQISNIPCFVLIVRGQEVERIKGVNSVGALQAMFQRAGFSPDSSVASAPGRRSRGPAAVGSAGLMAAGSISNSAAAPGSGFPGVVSDSPLATTAAGKSAGQADHGGAGGSAAPFDTVAATQPPALSIAACARLRVTDSKGNSIGSGTIIDARQGEALVLTCGHIFRDSDGKGEITVDLFGPGAPQKIPARLVSCDLERDVALVSFATKYSIRPAQVAPETSKVHPGDRIITIGCSHGEDPTIQESRVNSLDRFKGPPNIQVAGQPVQGRSGGGLFNAAGQVIGVCNAADPTDNEGLFAALASVYKELDRSGLTFVYRAGGDRLAVATSTSNSNSTAPPEGQSELPPMPERMPSVALGGSPTPVGDGTDAGAARSLSADELATLTDLRDKARSAEVICIVRSSSNRQAKSEIIVIDKATPDLLQQLTGEQRAAAGRSASMAPQAIRQLTSLEVPGSRATGQR